MVVVRLLSVVWPIAIGGKPPPTGGCGVRYVLAGRQEGQGSGHVDQTTQVQCGRGLAPDGGVSADIIID